MKRTLLLTILLIVWSITFSFGYNCPIIDSTSQFLCSSEGIGNDYHKPRISDLIATDGGAGISWFESSNSTVPLESNHLLESGMQYYADNSSGTCGNRIAVLITINDAPNAGATTFLTFCSNDSPINLLPLIKPSILGPPDTGGRFFPALASGTTVFDASFDKAGQYKYQVLSNTGLCPADDSYIYISIKPSGNAGEDGNITIDDPDSKVDLFTVLNGTPDIGGSWSPALVSGSGIFDPKEDDFGEYIYTIVSSNGCQDSSMVTVQNFSDPLPEPCPIVSNTSQSFCSSEGVGNDYHKPRISDLIATDGGAGISWFESSNSTVPLENLHLLESGKQYYADNSLGTCGNRIAVLITINDAPNAGATTFLTFCLNDNPTDLLPLIKPSILGPPDLGGTFFPALASGTTIYDPSVDKTGQYRYVVTSTTGLCPTDDAYIYINITNCDSEKAYVNEVSIYPNPSNGRFEIKELKQTHIKSVNIYDLNGKKIKEYNLHPEQDLPVLDLSNSKSGMYIAEFITSKGIITKKIIKR
ncbi:T9SS type A sorting domain-containing protein [Gillisia sp. CAL575]|uniref:T9SS type A sorting domain-containing protein n=1 Tax=Gillisia sp. CAL575 TaxID=985255 RepID=UPI0003A484EC|nr:T9SS type A sorting domain-containing protein [Gillisia sp. CAL575]